jgi:hypothetical protein
MKIFVLVNRRVLLPNEPDDEVCDATGDAMKNYCWLNKQKLISFKLSADNYSLSDLSLPPRRGKGLALILILKISPLPGLNKIGPGSRIEDIHGRSLSLVNGTVGYFIHLYGCGFAAITGNRAQ